MRLMTFPNAIVSGHQAFFTEEALGEIADTTIRSLVEFGEEGKCANSLVAKIKEKKMDREPVRVL
jgi:D-lactate dehydrogenase